MNCDACSPLNPDSGAAILTKERTTYIIDLSEYLIAYSDGFLEQVD